jgi:hypothetical protein
MSSDLSPVLLSYLAEASVTKKKRAQCNRDTRLWQDLRIYGEIADDFLTDISERHQIDLSGFDSEKYHLGEYQGKNLFTINLFFFLPFVNDYLRARKVCALLTLGMIDDAIVTKRLA